MDEGHFLEEQISTSPVEEVVTTVPKEALGLSPVAKMRSTRSKSTHSATESSGEEGVEPPKKFVLTDIPSPKSLVGAVVMEAEVASSEKTEAVTSRRSSRRMSQDAGEDQPMSDIKMTRRRSTMKESGSDVESKTPVTEKTEQIEAGQKVVEDTESPAPVKRRPGRPRKSIVEEKGEESSDEEEVPVARETRSKRTESKEEALETKEDVVVKRGRGRPRKESRESTPSPAAKIVRPTRSGHSTPTFTAPAVRSRSGSRASSTVDSSSEVEEETFTSPRPTRRTSVKPDAQPQIQLKRLPAHRLSQSSAGEPAPKKIAQKRPSAQSAEEEVEAKKAKSDSQTKQEADQHESESEDEEIILKPQPKKKVEPFVPKSSATSVPTGQEVSPKQISPTGSSPPVIGGERKGIFEQLTPIKKKSWRDEMDIGYGHVVPTRDKGQLPYISPARLTSPQARLTSRSPPSARSRQHSGSAHPRSRPVIRPPSPPRVTTPPKPKHVNLATSSKIESAKPSEPHRGRGRPPKNPSAASGTPPIAVKRLRDSSASGSECGDVSTKTEPKRGRGRPPKNQSPVVGQRSRDSSASGSESSQRGRKPKVQESSDSESGEDQEPSPRATRGSVEGKKRTTRSKSSLRR